MAAVGEPCGTPPERADGARTATEAIHAPRTIFRLHKFFVISSLL
jgi:hypothetical protein